MPNVRRGEMSDIIRYDDFQNSLARQRQAGPVVDYELGNDGTYRPVPSTGGSGRLGRPVPDRGPGLPLVGAAVDAVCLARAIAPNSFTRDLVSASPFDVVPGVRSARDRMFNRLCDETPDAGVPALAPIVGGQCDGDVYLVQATGHIMTGAPECDVQTPRQSQTARFWGPIGGHRYGGSGGPANVEIYCRGPASSPIKSPGWYGLTSFGGSADCGFAGGVTSLSVSRESGPPDNCGDGPYQPGPDEGPSLLPDLSIDVPLGGGNTVNLPINVSFSPEVGISIDVGDTNIDFDGVDISIDIDNDFEGGESLPSDGAGGGDCSPTSPEDGSGPDDEPVTPPPADNPPAPDEPPPPEQVIRGAYVTLTGRLSGSTEVLPNNGAPPAFVPDLGLVFFQVTTADGQTGWTNPMRLQTNQGYYEVPSIFGASDVKVTTRPGVNATIRPVYYVSST